MPFFGIGGSKKKKHVKDFVYEDKEENLLGEGGFGKVFLGENPKTGDKVAVKVVAVQGEADTREIMEEIRIMNASNQHPNIVKLLAHDQTKGAVNVVMELADGGPLFHHVVGKGTLDESEASRFFSQILRGLDYLHSSGIVHRDLKLENILLAGNSAQFTVKICDLGLAHMYARDTATNQLKIQVLREKVGSKSYTAPEVLDGKGYDGFCADVWSIGICLFCALCGFFPLDVAMRSDYRYDAVYKASKEGASVTSTLFKLYERGDPQTYLSDGAIELIDQTMCIDMKKRLPVRTAMQHKWFKAKAPTFRSGNSMDSEAMECADKDPTYRGAGDAASMGPPKAKMGPPPGAAMGLTLQKAAGQRDFGAAGPA